jgi:hypothetical protein
LRREPGTLTAIATLTPTAPADRRTHATQGDKRALATCAAAGLLKSVTLMRALKRRGARR